MPQPITLKTIKEHFERILVDIEGIKPAKDLAVDRLWVPFLEHYKNNGIISEKQEKEWSYEYWPEDVPKEKPEDNSKPKRTRKRRTKTSKTSKKSSNV